MKKIIFSFVFLAAMLSSAFSNAAGIEPSVEAKYSFNHRFAQSTNAIWEKTDDENVYKVTFTLNNQSHAAFFTEEGDYLGTLHEIQKSQLPVNVVTQLEKQYPAAHVFTAYEHANTTRLDYYIVIAPANHASIIVKATDKGKLSVFKK